MSSTPGINSQRLLRSVLAFLAITFLAAVPLFWWGTSEQLSSSSVTSIETGEPVDLWFTPQGELASAVIADRTVTVRNWNAQGRLQRTRSLQFPLSRSRPLPSESPVQQSLGRRRPGQEPPQIYQEISEDIPLFAVSRDWHYEIGSPNGLGLAVSPSGRLAVGTSNGTVLLSRFGSGCRPSLPEEPSFF